MAGNKKYLSKVVKGGNTLFIKDEEAREAISQLDPASAASVETCEAIIDELT